MDMQLVGKEVQFRELDRSSDGRNVYLNAVELRRSGEISDAQSLLIVHTAVGLLENEIANTEHSDPHRGALLETLRTGYGKLSVETSLPPQHRGVTLPYDWGHYIKRAVEVAKELGEYQD